MNAADHPPPDPAWALSLAHLVVSDESALSALHGRHCADPLWPALLWCRAAGQGCQWRQSLDNPVSVMLAQRLPVERILVPEVCAAALDGCLRQRLMSRGGDTVEKFVSLW